MVAKSGRGWRLAKTLIEMEAEINAKWPNRNKGSDGSIGDAAHQSRTSDHNAWILDPDGNRICSAIDITHDPAHGFDSYAFAEWLREKRDPRIKYVISNRRIFSATESPWTWRRYTGSNPHDHHVHISVKASKTHYDSDKSWGIGPINLPPTPPEAHPRPVPATLKQGAHGGFVITLQTAINNKGAKLAVDGHFGFATRDAVVAFQKAHGLHADGIVGPQTWKKVLA